MLQILHNYRFGHFFLRCILFKYFIPKSLIYSFQTTYFESLVQGTVGAASNMANSKQQEQLLSQAKSVTESALQFVYTVKDCGGNAKVHPFFKPLNPVIFLTTTFIFPGNESASGSRRVRHIDPRRPARAGQQLGDAVHPERHSFRSGRQLNPSYDEAERPSGVLNLARFRHLRRLPDSDGGVRERNRQNLRGNGNLYVHIYAFSGKKTLYFCLVD